MFVTPGWHGIPSANGRCCGTPSSSTTECTRLVVLTGAKLTYLLPVAVVLRFFYVGLSANVNVNVDDAKVDLWSAGVVLYELMTAKHPFGGTNQVQ